jgi:hypothetical protein
MAKKSRVFNIMQYEFHPETGEPLLNEETIKDAVAHRTIKRWAYVAHDRDVYSALDEEQNPEHIKGQTKPKHWHIALEMGSNQAEIGTIAKWFGIPENFVDIAKGKGAFLDIVQYLTHEGEKQQELGKRLYEDEEIKANFDFRKELDKRIENRLKYGKDLDGKEQQRYDVLYNGKSLLQCQKDDRVLYMEDYKELKKLRMEYLSQLPPPPMRINFYVQGRGGLGKGLMCRALARSLCPDMVDDSEIFFEVGAPGAAFEGYDGQPVIIWNDRRHGTLLKELKGRENVFNVFDTHPTRQKQNIKFGSVALVNKINIVNSVEPYDEFLDGFVAKHKNENGEWEQEEDKGQSYRRFPFIMPLREEDFDLMLNKGFMEGTNNFTEYEIYGNIRGNMQRLAERCGQNEKLLREMNDRVLLPVVEVYDKVEKQFSNGSEMTEEEEDAIRAEFADYGTSAPNEPFDTTKKSFICIEKDGRKFYSVYCPKGEEPTEEDFAIVDEMKSKDPDAMTPEEEQAYIVAHMNKPQFVNGDVITDGAAGDDCLPFG